MISFLFLLTFVNCLQTILGIYWFNYSVDRQIWASDYQIVVRARLDMSPALSPLLILGGFNG